MEIQSRAPRKRTVVLVPFPFQGHLTTMLQLGSILHSRGFTVNVVHTEVNAPDSSNHPEFMFLAMDDGLTGRDMSVRDAMSNTYDINENCKVPLQNYLVRMMENEDDQLACIIYDNLMFFVDSVATELKLPSIVMRPYNACYLNCLVTIVEHAESIFPVEDSRLLDPVPELHPLRFKDLPLHFVNNGVPEQILQYIRTTINKGSSVAAICNTMEDLENSWLLRVQEHYKVPFFPIGPIHKMAPSTSSTSILEEDNSCIAWLDGQGPNTVLYISFGSLTCIDYKELIEISWGLANSGQPFLWVVRPGSVFGSRWIEALPEGFEKMIGDRGRIVKWAPQKQVLAHPSIAGFLTHCGWNSALEGILEEVPLICRPFWGDHRVNARYLCQIYKVGMELEVFERTAIENAVRKLMLSEEGKDLKKRVVDIKQKIVAGMHSDGYSHKNLNDLVDFISSLPLCTSPKRDAMAILNTNDIPNKTIT